VAATLYEPPYRARVYVPPDAPVGYVAVQAHHASGDVAEDLVFLNGTGPAERVDVQLVELFTVVEDPQERPVRGLEANDFSVYEDGAEQPLADFREGVEMPLSLGLVIDTSASMTPSLRAAQTAAIDFTLLALSGEEDRAFVVGFDSRPELVQPLTAVRGELVDAIAGLRPGGVSALCDALVFSLVQMQRLPGRRALVVLTDGVGREERVDFGTCQRFVQRSGIPIYAILLAGDDPTAERQGGVDAEKLGHLTGSVGGRLYVADRLDRLGGVYRAVIEELRSQYLLTYYPRRAAAGPDEGWREVEVDVARPGLVARTLAGYYP
jgi:VWFA-related protein